VQKKKEKKKERKKERKKKPEFFSFFFPFSFSRVALPRPGSLSRRFFLFSLARVAAILH